MSRPTNPQFPSFANLVTEGDAVALARAVLSGSEDTVVLVGKETTFLHVGSIPARLGMEPDELIADPARFLAETDLARARRAFADVSETPWAVERIDVWLNSPVEAPFRVDATISNLTSTDLGGMIISMRPAERRSSMHSITPGGTAAREVVDRREFLQVLQRRVNRKLERFWKRPPFARATASDRRDNYCVAFLMVDRHGDLRARIGGEQTDDILMRRCRELNAQLRDRDLIAYLGAGEIALLLDGIATVEHARDVVKGPADFFARIKSEGSEIMLSPVVGVATSDRRYERAGDVLRHARSASRASRRRGRSEPKFFSTGMGAELDRRALVRNDLAIALEQGDIYAVYQPMVDLKKRQLVGFEALARWTHTHLGAVEPVEFVEAAEELGLIKSLGQTMLEQACKACVEWNRTRSMPLEVAVNLSPTELTDPTLPSRLEHIFSDTGLLPRFLTVEVTERALTDDVKIVADAMTTLRGLGVRLALDDFGTGHASLSHMIDLPFNRLKIDKSLAVDPGSKRLHVVQALVRLAVELGMLVTMEGIETVEQRRVITRIGCTYGQGFLLGHPLAAEEAHRVQAATRRW